MKRNVYLDNAATTKVYPKAASEMNKFYLIGYGNPGSMHELGENAQREMNDARKKIASEISAKPHEIIFTSGGTEANNLAIFGLAERAKNKNKVIISRIEHSSVFEPCEILKKSGYEIAEIKVDREGMLDIDRLEREIDDRTFLVSVIHANNEIGVLQNIRKIGEICRRKKVLFHTDAVQSFGKERINAREMNIDLLSASAHKIGGAKGTGFLFVREGIDISPLIIGGKQERGIRGGTENVAGIAGFVKALEITKKIDKKKIKETRDYLIEELEKIRGKINGSKDNRIYNNINVSFSGIDAEMLVLRLSEKGIYCSTRSACLSRQHEESRVLKAIGLPEKEIRGSLRLVLNEFVKKRDIDFVIREITKSLCFTTA